MGKERGRTESRKGRTENLGRGGGQVTRAVNLVVVYLRQDMCVDCYLPADDVRGASEVWKLERGRRETWSVFQNFTMLFTK